MALRKGHGHGKGKPRIETLPPDELPAGIHDDARPTIEAKKGQPFRFQKGNPLAATGGRCKKGSSQLVVKVVTSKSSVSPQMRKYVNRTERFRQVVCREFARDVGGGHCGAAVSAIVLGAAQARMWAQYFKDLAVSGGADIDLIMKAMRLDESCKSGLAMAQELCAKQAESRPVKREAMPWLSQGPAEDDAQDVVVEAVRDGAQDVVVEAAQEDIVEASQEEAVRDGAQDVVEVETPSDEDE